MAVMLTAEAEAAVVAEGAAEAVAVAEMAAAAIAVGKMCQTREERHDKRRFKVATDR